MMVALWVVAASMGMVAFGAWMFVGVYLEVTEAW